MSILLLIASGVLIACVLFWKSQRQQYFGERSSNSTSPPLLRSSPGSTKSFSDKNLSIDGLSRDVFKKFPHSLAIQKQILVNLKILEYKLTELENFLISKGLYDALVNQKPIEDLSDCSDSEDNN